MAENENVNRQLGREEPDNMTVPCGGGFINIRAAAIIMRDGKFLMAGNPVMGYLYSVGGRLHFGETAEDAVVREVEEETGVRMEIDRLGFVHEEYYTSDVAIRIGKPIYEITFYFYMKVPEDFAPVCGSFTEFGSEEFLTWASPDDERPFFPGFFRTQLRHPEPGMKHVTTRQGCDTVR